MHCALTRRSWACPAAQRGVLNAEGASATTAPKCTKGLIDFEYHVQIWMLACDQRVRRSRIFTPSVFA